MNAATARKAVAAWRKKAIADHTQEYNAIMAQERRETEAMWPTRGMMWVKKIEGYIQTAAVQGHNYTYEPTSTNPNGDQIIYIGGDQIIYIGKGDKPIYQKLMQYFRDKGFTVEEYQYMGMKITW
jgi:hypothetical protein